MRRQSNSLHLRSIAAVSAIALGLCLATVGSADAASVHLVACGSYPVQVGDKVAYNNKMVAGWVSQWYDPCVNASDNDTNLYAKWQWNPAYTEAHGTPAVRLYMGSMGRDNGQVFEVASFAGDTSPDFDLNSPEIGIHSANPDSWRVGGAIAGSDCLAWTSQHYYATGTETAGPYGGCGDNVNISTIPWTKP